MLVSDLGCWLIFSRVPEEIPGLHWSGSPTHCHHDTTLLWIVASKHRCHPSPFNIVPPRSHFRSLMRFLTIGRGGVPTPSLVYYGQRQLHLRFVNYFYVCTCALVHTLCTCMFVWSGVPAYVEARGQPQASFLSHCLPCVLKTGSLTGLEFAKEVAQAPGILLPPVPQYSVYKLTPPCPGFFCFALFFPVGEFCYLAISYMPKMNSDDFSPLYLHPSTILPIPLPDL